MPVVKMSDSNNASRYTCEMLKMPVVKMPIGKNAGDKNAKR